MTVSPRVSAKRSRAVPAKTSRLASEEPSRHLLRALEEERKRISRELHDETGQGLMVLRLYLSMLADEVKSRGSLQKISQATELLDRTIGDLRRIIARLSPRVLEELGLVTAIRKEARELSKNKGMKADLTLPKALAAGDYDVHVALYRSVQEALHNVAKHSKATKFEVVLEETPDRLRLLVHDDGIGFVKNARSRQHSFGLVGMRERIAALGGEVRINSAGGRGTTLDIVVPVKSPEAIAQSDTQGEVVPFVKRTVSHKAG